MTLQFPNSPTDGELYTDTTSGNRWVWDSANTVWKSTSTFTQTITVSSTQPGSPVVGQLWWSQDYGRLFVYYNDGNSSQWVEANPADQTAGLVFNTANAAFGKANAALANATGTFAGTLTVSGTETIINTSNSTISLQITGNTSNILGIPSIRAIGHSPSYELLNRDFTQNWYMGIADNDSKALYIGRGYGPGQGVTPAIKIDINDRVTMPNRPLFRAYINSAADTSYTINTILPFNAAYANIGSYYSTSNYLFTAPVTGYYYFHSAVYGTSSGGAATMALRWYINGSVASVPSTSDINIGTGGGQVSIAPIQHSTVFYLNANDTVGSYCTAYNGTAIFRIYTGASIFEGWLIG